MDTDEKMLRAEERAAARAMYPSCSGTGETSTPPTPWTLDDALATVRRIEPAVRKLGLFTALTGGVLYRGESAKDLDIGFAQLGDHVGDYPIWPLRGTLEAHGWKLIKSAEEVWAFRRERGLLPEGVTRNEVECWVDDQGRRVDVFIWRDPRVAAPAAPGPCAEPPTAQIVDLFAALKRSLGKP